MNVGRYMKKIINLGLNIVGNIYAILFYRRRLEKDPCDILYVAGWAGDIERANKLSETLEKENFHIHKEVWASPLEIIRDRLLVKAKRVSPFSYCYLECYAAYLIKRHQPKIILAFLDAGLLSFFLKIEIEKVGGKIINLSHAVMMDNYTHTNFYFHYYFMFGQYSVEAAFRQKTRYGNTKLIKAGSHLIEKDFYLPVNKESNKLLLLAASCSKIENKIIILRNYNLLAKWARIQKRYHLVIKHHPAGDDSIIESFFKDIHNVTFFSKETNMKNALKDVSLTLIGWSTGSIEAALLNRPSVIINDSDMPDFLEAEKYFAPRARNVEEIQDRIEETFERYDYYLEKSKEYVRKHLEYTTDSIPFMVHCIKSINDGDEDFEYIPIEATEDYFLHNN